VKSGRFQVNDYTVIGYFENTGARFMGHHQAETPTDAIRDAIQSTAYDLVIVEVIAGFHEGLTYDEHVEHACDFLAAEEADEEATA
jgi:hypothetical protein